MAKIYTGNHTNLLGVADIVELIMGAGTKAGLNFEVCNDMSEGVFILIDEFSSAYELRNLIKQKKKKCLKFILVCTEFETDTFSGQSFNEFENPGRVRSIIIKLLGLVLFLTPKLIRENTILRRVIAFGAVLCFRSPLFSQKIPDAKAAKTLVSDLKRQIYMKARRQGYEIFKKVADLTIKIHPLNDRNIQTKTLLPIIENFEQKCINNIKVSGTETSYRIKMCEEFREQLESSSMGFNFDYSGNIKFHSHDNKKTFDFAYQPAQTSNWLKSNPVKIWRDLHFNGALPILDKKFDDHPIEMIGIMKEEFFNQLFDYTSINRKVNEYCEVAARVNKEVFISIKKLEKF